MEYAWIGLCACGGALLLFLAVILLRAARFRPAKQEREQPSPECFDRDRAVFCLQELIRYPTVSHRDAALEDDAAFEGLLARLPELYPEVWRTCTCVRLPDRGLLLRWTGREQDAPTVLMAHYDVVPAEEENWEKPPFAGILEEGVLWGRGALDTKVTLNAALSAAEHLIPQGFLPQNDVFFAFSGGEEVSGKGAKNIVEWFVSNGITPAMVLDEGGAVVENVFPGVAAPCGLVGIAEKGMLNLEYRVEGEGGHASAPLPHTPVGELAEACRRVEKHPFQSKMTLPVAQMFDTLGRHSTFLYRVIFANLWCFRGVLDLICRKQGGELNALMRTTVAFTQMKGSEAPNVIPPSASLVSNIRLNPKDTVEGAVSYIWRTVDNDRVALRVLDGANPSGISRTDCPSYERIASAIRGTWPGVLVSPYLMVQCSDSRHWSGISDRIYRFSAMDLTTEERRTIHGNNERIRVESIHRAVEFYIRLVRQC